MQYSTEQNPDIACQDVPESAIHLVAYDKDIESGRHDWDYVLRRNGYKCERKWEAVPQSQKASRR
jgi:hypothetical protein